MKINFTLLAEVHPGDGTMDSNIVGRYTMKGDTWQDCMDNFLEKVRADGADFVLASMLEQETNA